MAQISDLTLLGYLVILVLSVREVQDWLHRVSKNLFSNIFLILGVFKLQRQWPFKHSDAGPVRKIVKTKHLKIQIQELYLLCHEDTDF